MLLTGELPFPAQNLNGLRKYVIGKAAFPVGNLETKSVSVSGCEAIQKLMQPNPGLRPSADAALGTVWLRVASSRTHPGPPGVVPKAAQSNPLAVSEASARWTDVEDTGFQTFVPSDDTDRDAAPLDSWYQTVVSHARERPAVSKDATKCRRIIVRDPRNWKDMAGTFRTKQSLHTASYSLRDHSME